jgi:hypothetical protein
MNGTFSASWEQTLATIFVSEVRGRWLRILRVFDTCKFHANRESVHHVKVKPTRLFPAGFTVHYRTLNDVGQKHCGRCISDPNISCGGK